METRELLIIMMIAPVAWFVIAVIGNVQRYMHRRRKRLEHRAVQLIHPEAVIALNKENNMGLKIKYVTTYPGIETKHMDELKTGDVFMSGKHDPRNLREGMGLYLVVRRSSHVFCVSLKGTVLSYDEMKRSLACCGGMVTMLDAEVTVTVRMK